MKPYCTPLLFLFLLLTMCAPALYAPAQRVSTKTPSAQASPSKQERKQILRYYIRVCRLTYRIDDVQRAENGLLQHPSYWLPLSVWSKKMRLRVAYVHTLREEAKSLKPPPACQPANQDLVASLTLLETAFLKTYQAQIAPNEARAKSEIFAREATEASEKSKVFQYKFLKAIYLIQARFHMPINRYNVTDWPTAAM